MMIGLEIFMLQFIIYDAQELPPVNANSKSSKASANDTAVTNSAPAPAPAPAAPPAHTATIDKKNISAPITVTIGRIEVFAVAACAHRSARAVRGTYASSCEDEHYTLMNGTAVVPAKANSVSPAREGGGGGQDNPFEEDDWDEEDGGALRDTGEPGVPVRALYDYTGAESDELSFRQGDLFEKLEDEDEQGWCKGRKDGRVGLYPANYVEPVGH
ncbi:Antigen EG13 [Eumeta japonica]|uniref:Antigen EG13 n=1 Tax=Eumeta variegata TaxID=151549 RepID=A0A4C1X862_EUMVA|nr:Antigen EG13 [Eumeta japonica]